MSLEFRINQYGERDDEGLPIISRRRRRRRRRRGRGRGRGRHECEDACMAREVDGRDILWRVWGPPGSQEEREERPLLALLPHPLPPLPPSPRHLSLSPPGTPLPIHHNTTQHNNASLLISSLAFIFHACPHGKGTIFNFLCVFNLSHTTIIFSRVRVRVIPKSLDFPSFSLVIVFFLFFNRKVLFFSSLFLVSCAVYLLQDFKGFILGNSWTFFFYGLINYSLPFPASHFSIAIFCRLVNFSWFFSFLRVF